MLISVGALSNDPGNSPFVLTLVFSGQNGCSSNVDIGALRRSAIGESPGYGLCLMLINSVRCTFVGVIRLNIGASDIPHASF